MFRMILGLVGVVGLVVALPLLFSGGSLLWFDAFFADEDGFMNSAEMDVEVDGFALVAGPAVIEGLPEFPDSPIQFSELATLRVRAEDADPTMGIFIGVAGHDDVETYLGSSPYATVEEIEEEGLILVYRTDVEGDVPLPPGDQAFWSATAQGTGEQTLEWDLESGEVSFVVMNEDASDGLAFTTTLGVRVPILQPIGIALAVGGGALLAVGAVLLAIAL